MTPTSQPPLASTTSPASTSATKSSSRAAPALPILPAVPKPDSKDAKAPTREGGGELKPEGAENEEAKVNGARAEEAQSTDSSAAAPTPASVPQKPKSWASLLSTPASKRAAGVASSGASSTASAGGPTAGSTDTRNGTPAMFSRPADSLADALRAYRVGATNTVTHIEPRGLMNGGNMCYMNSVGSI